jgi:hypothetical protein
LAASFLLPVFVRLVFFFWPAPAAGVFAILNPRSALPTTTLNHDPIKLNLNHGLAFCLSMILFRKPDPLFGIML